MYNFNNNIKAILLLLSLAFFNNIYGQTYYKMLDNPSWTVKEPFVEPTGIIKLGDTLIDNKHYVVIYDSMPMGDGAIKILREDSATRKVFKRENDQDVLLFDFSLQVSDKIILSNGGEYTVSSIDSVSVRGGVRKRLYLTHSMFGNQYWVEGVGNTEHPLLQLNPLSVPVSLICSFQNGVNVFNRGIYSSSQDTSDCKAYNISSKRILTENSLKVYPNPATNILHIEFTSTVPNKIEVMDLQGRTVFAESILPTQKTCEISLGNLSNGVYFVKLYSDEGVVLKKVIKE
jgi:hypothetical protein